VGHDREVEFGSESAHERHVAGPAATEVEVFPHDDGCDTEAVDQDAPNEIIRGLGGLRFVETNDGDRIHPGLGEEFEFLVLIGEQTRSRLGSHEAGWMAIERDDHAHGRALAGHGLHMVDHGAMARVQAVVGPDGHDAALVGPHPPREVVDDQHGRNASSGCAKTSF